MKRLLLIIVGVIFMMSFTSCSKDVNVPVEPNAKAKALNMNMRCFICNKVPDDCRCSDEGLDSIFCSFCGIVATRCDCVDIEDLPCRLCDHNAHQPNVCTIVHCPCNSLCPICESVNHPEEDASCICVNCGESVRLEDNLNHDCDGILEDN